MGHMHFYKISPGGSSALTPTEDMERCCDEEGSLLRLTICWCLELPRLWNWEK